MIGVAVVTLGDTGDAMLLTVGVPTTCASDWFTDPVATLVYGTVVVDWVVPNMEGNHVARYPSYQQ